MKKIKLKNLFIIIIFVLIILLLFYLFLEKSQNNTSVSNKMFNNAINNWNKKNGNENIEKEEDIEETKKYFIDEIKYLKNEGIDILSDYFNKNYTKEDFINDLMVFEEKVNSMSNFEYEVELLKIYRKLNDSRFVVYESNYNYVVNPFYCKIYLEKYNDGFLIVRADRIHESIIGCKLLEINGYKIDDIYNKLAKEYYYFSYEFKSPKMFEILNPYVLKDAGFIEDLQEEQLFTVQNSKGTIINYTFKLNKRQNDLTCGNLLNLYSKRKIKKPLFRKNNKFLIDDSANRQNKSWFKVLKKDILYLRIYFNRNFYDNSFYDKLNKTLKNKNYNIILDIRDNMPVRESFDYDSLFAFLNRKEFRNKVLLLNKYYIPYSTDHFLTKDLSEYYIVGEKPILWSNFGESDDRIEENLPFIFQFDKYPNISINVDIDKIVPYTIEDVWNGTDPQLQKAIEYLNNHK